MRKASTTKSKFEFEHQEFIDPSRDHAYNETWIRWFKSPKTLYVYNPKTEKEKARKASLE